MNINVAQAKKVRAGLSCYKTKQFLAQTAIRSMCKERPATNLEFRKHSPFGDAGQIASPIQIKAIIVVILTRRAWVDFRHVPQGIPQTRGIF